MACILFVAWFCDRDSLLLEHGPSEWNPGRICASSSDREGDLGARIQVRNSVRPYGNEREVRLSVEGWNDERCSERTEQFQSRGCCRALRNQDTRPHVFRRQVSRCL